MGNRSLPSHPLPKRVIKVEIRTQALKRADFDTDGTAQAQRQRRRFCDAWNRASTNTTAQISRRIELCKHKDESADFETYGTAQAQRQILRRREVRKHMGNGAGE